MEETELLYSLDGNTYYTSPTFENLPSGSTLFMSQPLEPEAIIMCP